MQKTITLFAGKAARIAAGFGIISFFSLHAAADWSLRPQVGLGYTSNANYEATEKDADTFWWVRSSNTYFEGTTHWNLWLNYRDYMKESQNDVFNYRIGRTAEVTLGALGKTDWDLALGGQQFTNENPGTTENSFNNLFVETSLAKTKSLSSTAEATFGPLYRLTTYPGLANRTDHMLLFNAGLDWNYKSDQLLAPYVDLGYVLSNQSLYTKHFLEAGADWRFSPDADTKYSLLFLSKYSSYPNRRLTDSTAVTTRSGKTRTTSRDEIEAQSLFQIQGSLAKMVGNIECKGSVAYSSQTTRSGIEDYNEMQITGAITIPYDFPGKGRP